MNCHHSGYRDKIITQDRKKFKMSDILVGQPRNRRSYES